MDRRKYLRFNPEQMEVAIISLKSDDVGIYDDTTVQFNGDMIGLILDQSYSGCSVVMRDRKDFQNLLEVDSVCIVKAGELAPMKSVVRWKERLEQGIWKLGFEFLE